MRRCCRLPGGGRGERTKTISSSPPPFLSSWESASGLPFSLVRKKAAPFSHSEWWAGRCEKYVLYLECDLGSQSTGSVSNLCPIAAHEARLIDIFTHLAIFYRLWVIKPSTTSYVILNISLAFLLNCVSRFFSCVFCLPHCY